jgi:hypothetical protein
MESLAQRQARELRDEHEITFAKSNKRERAFG